MNDDPKGLLSKYIIGIVVILIAAIVFLIFKYYNFTNGQGSGVRSQAALSQGFPEVPIYPDTTLVDSSTNTPGGFLYEATWQTRQSIPEVSSWYLGKISDGNWEIVTPPADLNAKDIQLLIANKDDLVYNFSFIKDNDSGITNVIIQIAEPADNEEEYEE
jgi:hypothetical protein